MAPRTPHGPVHPRIQCQRHRRRAAAADGWHQAEGDHLMMMMMIGLHLQTSSNPLLSLSTAGSGRAQFIRPQRSEASHQRRPNCRGEGEESSGQTGEAEGKTAKERPGAAQELTATTRGRQRAEQEDGEEAEFGTWISVSLMNYLWLSGKPGIPDCRFPKMETV